MDGIAELQNLAGKVEEIKEKITDEEYKDLLELTNAYYDKEVAKKEKAKKKRFMKIMCVSTHIVADVDVKHKEMSSAFGEWGGEIEWEYGSDEEECDEGPISNIKVKAKAVQTNQIILFEQKSREFVQGYCIDMKNCIMTEYAYDEMLKDKYTANASQNTHQNSQRPTTFIYLSHFEV